MLRGEGFSPSSAAMAVVAAEASSSCCGGVVDPAAALSLAVILFSIRSRFTSSSMCFTWSSAASGEASPSFSSTGFSSFFTSSSATGAVSSMDSLILSSSQISPSKEFVSPAAPLASKCLLSFSIVQQPSMQAISSDGDASGCADFGVRRCDVDKQDLSDRYEGVRYKKAFPRRSRSRRSLVFLFVVCCSPMRCTLLLPSRRVGEGRIHLDVVDVRSWALFMKALTCGRCRFTYNGLGTMHTEHDELHNTQATQRQ
jgi:hypothetical protein